MAEYHDAPYTLDPTKDLPDEEEIAPAAGHDEPMAEKVREFHEEHKAGVEEAADAAADRAESDVPEPPYPAGHDAGVPPDDEAAPPSETAPEAEPKTAEGGASQGPPDGTVSDVLDWVGDDPARAREALDAEQAGQNRATLVAELEKRAAA